MSQTNTSTNTSTKRSYTNALNSTNTTTLGSGCGGGAPPPPSPHFPAMKKAKSQAVACSLDSPTQQPQPTAKNGQQSPHVHFATSVDLDLDVVDPSSMIQDPNPHDFSATVDASSPVISPASAGGVTANLSRKKATPPQPAKKLVIKLVKAKPTLPTNFEENTWAKLKSAITAIFLRQPDPCDLEKLYQAVNDLCLHKMGGNLYQRIERECESHVSAALKSLVGQSDDTVVFLSLVEKCWQDFCDQMLMIRGIALYLDRTYVKQTSNVRSLWDMGLQLFRKHVSLAAEVEHKTVFGLLKMIESERLQSFQQQLSQNTNRRLPNCPMKKLFS